MKTKKALFAIAVFFVFFAWNPASKSENGLQAGASALLAADQAQDTAPRVRVVVRFAKIRSLPNAGARIIKEIGFGTMLLVLGKSGEYLQVAALDMAAKPEAEAWYVLQSEVETAPAAAVQALAENRRVTYTPSAPVAGQPLVFTVSNFRTPNLLKWDMGDGTVLTSGGKASPGQEATLAYAYAVAGQFQVKVYDDNGNMGSAPVRTQVTVSAHARTLHVAPERPLANHPVAISAQHFHTPEKIAWDLGDGTGIKPGPGPGVVKASFLVSHVYASPGTYTVKAYDSDGDKNQPPLTVEFVVAADPRQVRMEPARAVAGSPLQFSAANFNTPNHLRWDMGDGTVLPGENEVNVLIGSLVNYRYKKPGSYLVKVYDWDGDPSRQPVQFVVAVPAAPDVAAAEPTVSTPAKTLAMGTVAAAVPAPKKYLMFKIGPYAGYFQPQDALFKQIYGKGDVLYGARLGVHVWQGFYFWLSASQYKVISKTTYTEDKTTLTLLPVSAFLRYSIGLGFFNPYAGLGYTFVSIKEESEFVGNFKGNGSNVSVEAGFELKMNRHFSLDFGARFDQIKIKPENIGEEIDLGGLQAGVTLLVSF
jgi:PKD repeat protein